MEEKYLEKIKVFYNQEGLLTQYPSKRPMREIALGRIAAKFEANRKYTEKEVNKIIKDSISFSDVEWIRRELYQWRFLDRLKDGSEYWLIQE